MHITDSRFLQTNNFAVSMYNQVYTTRDELRELLGTEVFSTWADLENGGKNYPRLADLPEFSKWFEVVEKGLVDDEPVISAGGSKSGLSFNHNHGGAFLVLHHGKRQWFLSPPRRSPGPLLQWSRPWNWFTKLYDTLADKEKPQFKCTQLPGEVMYVPEFWWHATINIGETFAHGAMYNSYLTQDKEGSQYLHNKLKGRELDQPIHQLNHLVATGKRKDALKVAKQAWKENKGEIPIAVLYSQLAATLGDTKPAKLIFKDVLDDLENARAKKYITKHEGAFIFMKLASSIANAGFNPDYAIDLSRKQTKEWYSEEVMRDLVYALLATKQQVLAANLIRELTNDERWKNDDHGKMWGGYLARIEDKNASRGMLMKLAKEIKTPPGATAYVMSSEPDTEEY